MPLPLDESFERVQVAELDTGKLGVFGIKSRV